MDHPSKDEDESDNHEILFVQLSPKAQNAAEVNRTKRNEVRVPESDDDDRNQLPTDSVEVENVAQSSRRGAGSCQSEIQQQQQLQQESNITPHVVLSCFVFWLCGVVFGFIAYLLAAKAEDNAASKKTKARQLGRASLVFSILGIIAGVIVIAVVLGVVYGRPYKCIADSEYRVGGGCFRNQSIETADVCQASYEYSYHDGVYCYFNCRRGLYDVKGNCFRLKDFFYPRGEDWCSGGFDGQTSYVGKYCYHQCPCMMFLAADGNCYNSKTSVDVVDADNCISQFTNVYFDGARCYSNCSTDICPRNCSSPTFNRIDVNRCERKHDDYFYNDGLKCYLPGGAYSYNTDGRCFTSRFYRCSSAVRIVALSAISAVSSVTLICALSNVRLC